MWKFDIRDEAAEVDPSNGVVEVVVYVLAGVCRVRDQTVKIHSGQLDPFVEGRRESIAVSWVKRVLRWLRWHGHEG